MCGIGGMVGVDNRILCWCMNAGCWYVSLLWRKNVHLLCELPWGAFRHGGLWAVGEFLSVFSLQAHVSLVSLVVL